MVQLAQACVPARDGARIFPDFMAKREQSVRVRDGLVELTRAVRAFQDDNSEENADQMKGQISDFYDPNIKYLMYRDWSGFELFYIEILKCPSLSGLTQIAHRFETFLLTLLREVQKRSILDGAPASPEVKTLLPEA